MTFFDDIIEKFLINSNEFKQMFTIDIIIEDNIWSNTLYKEIKKFSLSFTSLIQTIIDTMINIIKSIMNDERWEIALVNILKTNILNILENNINDFLSNLQNNFFTIFNNFMDVTNDTHNKIRSINDIIVKYTKIGNNEIDNVIFILKQNKIINNMGIIDGKKIFGINYKEVNNIPLQLFSKFENNYDTFEKRVKIVSSEVALNTIGMIEEAKQNSSDNINNINNNTEQMIEIYKTNFGKYNDKKEEIINSLKHIRQKIDSFKPEEKCKEIINQLKSIFISEITNIFLEALNKTEFKDFIGKIQDNVTEILDDVSKKMEI